MPMPLQTRGRAGGLHSVQSLCAAFAAGPAGALPARLGPVQALHDGPLEGVRGA